MATPIVAPYVPTYALVEPYISADEFKKSPTGTNINQLAAGYPQVVNDDVLAQTILNASAWADWICNQTLACTTAILFGTYRVQPDSRVLIPVKQLPVVQLNAVSVGTPGSMEEAATLDAVTFPKPNIIAIPYAGYADPVDVQIEYLAGFPNTFLTANAAVGLTLTVGNTLGLVAGSRLLISDPGKSELVTVASVTDTVITLATASTQAHDSGTNVSALPPAIKQAVILLTSVLIKSRGADAVVIQSISGGQSVQDMDPAVASLFAEASALLSPFVRVA